MPEVVICDRDLSRALPRRLIAATRINAPFHCIENYVADPPNPVVDALALDGIAGVRSEIGAAVEPAADAARASLMAAAFAGGAAIHKDLGSAHAVAHACSDQDLHRGTLIRLALPLTVELVVRNSPTKESRVAAALGLRAGFDISDVLMALSVSIGLRRTVREADISPSPATAWSTDGRYAFAGH